MLPSSPPPHGLNMSTHNPCSTADLQASMFMHSQLLVHDNIIYYIQGYLGPDG